LSELQRLFELPAHAEQRHDPWWSYQTAQARKVDEWFDELLHTFRDSITP
jgi:hypothetical protein